MNAVRIEAYDLLSIAEHLHGDKETESYKDRLKRFLVAKDTTLLCDTTTVLYIHGHFFQPPVIFLCFTSFTLSLIQASRPD